MYLIAKALVVELSASQVQYFQFPYQVERKNISMSGALRPAVAAARASLLQHLRVGVTPALHTAGGLPGQSLFDGLCSVLAPRYFSDAAKGTYLDKGQVTDRVLSVVKNFQKVEPSKVSASDG